MHELSGKQKRFLCRRAGGLNAAVSIGKAGVSEATVERIRQLLEAHELVKLRLPAGLGRERKQMAERLAEAAAAACVEILGRTVLLYRPSRRLGEDERIVLPQ